MALRLKGTWYGVLLGSIHRHFGSHRGIDGRGAGILVILNMIYALITLITRSLSIYRVELHHMCKRMAVSPEEGFGGFSR